MNISKRGAVKGIAVLFLYAGGLFVAGQVSLTKAALIFSGCVLLSIFTSYCFQREQEVRQRKASERQKEGAGSVKTNGSE